MKSIIILLILTIAGMAAGAKRELTVIAPGIKTLEFTESTGDQAEARLFGFDPKASLVKMRLIDESKIDVDLSLFSPADQSYIQNWHSAYTIVSKKKLFITVEEEKNKDLRYNGELDNWHPMFPNMGYDDGWQTWPPPAKIKAKHAGRPITTGTVYDEISYEMTIKNKTSTSLRDIRIEYCIYHQTEIKSGEASYTEAPKKSKNKFYVPKGHKKLPKQIISNTIRGEFIIPELPVKGEIVKQTDLLKLVDEAGETKTEGPFEPAASSKKSKKSSYFTNTLREVEGELLGIRYRVYLPLASGEYVMQEFADPTSLIKTTKWSTSSAR